MRYLYPLIALTILFSIPGKGQEFVLDGFDNTYIQWESMSPQLEKYETMKQYCRDWKFRKSVQDLMLLIHHYDTLILKEIENHKIFNSKKISHKIQRFEIKYSSQNFIAHLDQECHDQKVIELERGETSKDFGEYSYDAMRYVVDTEIYQYVHHLSNKLAEMKELVHRINIELYLSYDPLDNYN